MYLFIAIVIVIFLLLLNTSQISRELSKCTGVKDIIVKYKGMEIFTLTGSILINDKADMDSTLNCLKKEIDTALLITALALLIGASGKFFTLHIYTEHIISIFACYLLIYSLNDLFNTICNLEVIRYAKKPILHHFKETNEYCEITIPNISFIHSKNFELLIRYSIFSLSLTINFLVY